MKNDNIYNNKNIIMYYETTVHAPSYYEIQNKLY